MFQLIQSLHHTYCDITGLGLTLDANRERGWYDWLKHRPAEPFTEDDLKLVVAHLKKGIREGTRRAQALLFRNLIVSCDHFEEDLAIARAEARIPYRDKQREAALRATGRPTVEKDTAKKVGEIMQTGAFKAFVALRENL